MWNSYKKRKSLLILGLVLLAGILWLRGLQLQSVPEYQREQQETAGELGLVSQAPEEPGLTEKPTDADSREASGQEAQNRKGGGTAEAQKADGAQGTGKTSSEDSQSSSRDRQGSGKKTKKTSRETKQSSGKSGGTNSAGIGAGEAADSDRGEQQSGFSTGETDAGGASSESGSGEEAQEAAKPAATKTPAAAQKISCSLEIRCDTLAENKNKIDSSYWKYIPADGVILKKTTVSVDQGTSAYELLAKVCQVQNIALDAAYTPMYKSYYVSGIAHLYEKQAGSMSGWIYKVNGKSPNRGASAFALSDGDECCWYYTCDGKIS